MNHLANTSPNPSGLRVSKAKGSLLWDEGGKRYIDFIAGISVANLGHGHPSIGDAVKEQMDRFGHVMVYGEYAFNIVERAASTLIHTLPPALDTVYFVNSGAESIEASMKLVKRATGRRKIIAFEGAYHGSTQGSLSLSSVQSRKAAFEPLLPDIDFIRLNDVTDLVKINQECAGVFLETVQADAGVRIPEASYMRSLRKRCTEAGALLVLDEIQVGLGRTGVMHAFEQYGIVPDILCLGKALGGGLPIGALVSSQNLLDNFTHNPVLGHITTFGGNPVICAAANAYLKELESSGIVASVEAKGKRMTAALMHPSIRDLRRSGLMLALELESAEVVDRVISRCLDQGLTLFRFLSTPNAFRISPALNISDELIDEGCAILLKVLDDES